MGGREASRGIVGGPSEKSWRSYFGTRYIVDGAKVCPDTGIQVPNNVGGPILVPGT
jgi:hypothetical protein